MNRIPSISAPQLFTSAKISCSRFVRLNDTVNFDISMQYPLMKMKNSVTDCFVREEVFDKLLKVSKALDGRYRLKILDAWRPLALQYELYYTYRELILKEFRLENEDDDRQSEIIKKFVSYPSDDFMVPPVHTTGGAVDLTLTDINGNELEMGTGFDSFSDKTRTDYYETNSIDLNIRNNRRILYNAMISAGFTNLPSEWWHFDFGDRFWGYYNNKPAIYEGVFDISEINRRKI